MFADIAIQSPTDACSEARIIHGLNEECLSPPSSALTFSVFRKFPSIDGCLTSRKSTQQKSYSLSTIDFVARSLAKQPDSYISQSSFVGLSRKISGFAQVRSAWVDIDLYKAGMVADEKTIRVVSQMAVDIGIPEPSLIVFSGRGLYVKWFFTDAITDLTTWNHVQRLLTLLYSNMHSDFNAIDASRVLRSIETIHSETQERVSPVGGCMKAYAFPRFMQAVLAMEPELNRRAGEADVRTYRARVAKAANHLQTQMIDGVYGGDLPALDLYAASREPVLLAQRTAGSLNWARFYDLRTLMFSRGGAQKGIRDTLLFWMVNSLAHAQVITPDNWTGEVSDLLKAFPVGPDFDPIGQGYLASVQERVRLHAAGETIRWKGRSIPPLYKVTNAFLIDALDISDSEQRMLRTIISPEEKSRRKTVRRDELNPGREGRRSSRLDWRAKADTAAQEMKEAGLPIIVSDLAKSLGVERTALSRYLKKSPKPTSEKDVARSPADQIYAEIKKIQKQAIDQAIHFENKASDQARALVNTIASKRGISPSAGRITTPTDLAKGGNMQVQAVSATETNVQRSIPSPADRLRAVIKKPVSKALPAAPASTPAKAQERMPVENPAQEASSPPPEVKPQTHSATERLRSLSAIAAGQSNAQSTNARVVMALPGYPGKEQWPHDDLPAGSFHSAGDWLEARQGGRCFVVEVQDGDHCGFMRFAKPGIGMVTVIENGLPIKKLGNVWHDEEDGIQPGTEEGLDFGRAFDGCILVTDPSQVMFPAAVENQTVCVQGRDFYVIRSRADILFKKPALFKQLNFAEKVEAAHINWPGASDLNGASQPRFTA